MIAKLLERITDGNPQLLREVKGKATSKNLTMAIAISIVGQIIVFLYYQNLLPLREGSRFNRYCTAKPPADLYNEYTQNNYCIQDLNGQWMILRELWWLDIFISLSIIGIFALLVVGTYQLIVDLSTEERQGTLNFIRLSPQSAKDIFIGKILGVPILLYVVSALALPLHLGAGLSAHIPLGLILAFYGVLIASCAFFYRASLVFALASHWLGGFQAWLASGTVFVFLFYATTITLSGYGDLHSPFDWLILFYPGCVLPYLVKSTFLPPDVVVYFNIRQLSSLLWYGHSLWQSSLTGIGFILLNFGLWTYGLTRALKRRFHNPLATLLNKSQSYWLTGCFSIIGVGFVLQTLDASRLFINYGIFTVFLGVFSLMLVVALTPPRQTVQDWMRYRHTDGKKRHNLLKALIFGQKSPATLAIAINLGIASLFVVPTILVSPLSDYKFPTLAGFWLGVNMLLVYAAIAQLILLWKLNKRSLLAASLIAFLVTFPILCFVVLGISPQESPLLWSFSFLPMVAAQHVTAMSLGLAVLGQWSSLILVGWKINRQLGRLGVSATKSLLSPR